MATEPMDRHTFLVNLQKSGLLAPERFHTWLRHVPDEEKRGRALAKSLVEQGILTRFQAQRLLAGRTDGFVLGQYRVLEELGRGGMGRVYKAEHQTMGRIVALKVLAADLTRTEKARNLFQREVRAAARLVDPNIVTAFDANQMGDRLYLVLEFVDGPNLQDLVRERGPLPVSQACDFIRQAALGLHHAHEMGMVHRDVKPSNLLVQRTPGRPADLPPTYQVKILDFGLARVTDPATGEALDSSPNTVMGTPDFLAPEQARTLNQVDRRSDIYGLGCTFYFLLTARVPFPGGSTLEKLVRHGTEEPRPVERLRPDILLPVAQILRKMMAKEPAGRYPTAAELAQALVPYCVARPAETWEVPPPAEPLPDTTPTPLPTSGPAQARIETPLDAADPHPPERKPDPSWTDLDQATPPPGRKRPSYQSGLSLRLDPPADKWRWLMPILIAVATLVVGFLVGVLVLT